MNAVGASTAPGVLKVTMPSKVIALNSQEYDGLCSAPFARKAVEEETDFHGLLVPGKFFHVMHENKIQNLSKIFSFRLLLVVWNNY